MLKKTLCLLILLTFCFSVIAVTTSCTSVEQTEAKDGKHHDKTCPYCNEKIGKGNKECPKCKKSLTDDVKDKDKDKVKEDKPKEDKGKGKGKGKEK